MYIEIKNWFWTLVSFFFFQDSGPAWITLKIYWTTWVDWVSTVTQLLDGYEVWPHITETYRGDCSKQTYTVHTYTHTSKHRPTRVRCEQRKHTGWLELSCYTSLNWEMNLGWIPGSIPDKNPKAYWGFTIKCIINTFILLLSHAGHFYFTLFFTLSSGCNLWFRKKTPKVVTVTLMP